MAVTRQMIPSLGDQSTQSDDRVPAVSQFWMGQVVCFVLSVSLEKFPKIYKYIDRKQTHDVGKKRNGSSIYRFFS